MDGIRKINPKLPVEQARRIAAEIWRIKNKELVLGVMTVESTFREEAVSRCGARGLMQIRSEIWGSWTTMREHIELGIGILDEYIGKHGLWWGLQKYSGGKRGYADRVLQEAEKWGSRL